MLSLLLAGDAMNICAARLPTSAKVRVAPFFGAGRMPLPLIGNADTTRETDASVHYQQPAMRGVVHASESIFTLPAQSSVTCTGTPAAARSASASLNARPISPDQ